MFPSHSVLLIPFLVCDVVVYEIKLGTVDQAEVDIEWKLRPYMNTAKKRLALAQTEPDSSTHS